MLASVLVADAVSDAVADPLIAELSAIVGRQHVVADEAGRALHSRTTEPRSRRCGAVVTPGTAQEVAAVVALAARRGLEVWPFSRGNSWGYGTKNAIAPGAIILVLERMNRILEVNEALAYAVLEPGVTQQQLYEYLLANHPNLIADCTDSTPLGSVLGNAIERGYGYTPYGDHFAHLCGLEIITPLGELLHTGGSSPSCPTWSTHKWGSGPSLEGLYSQGNFGVIIKGGIWLHPRPEQLLLFTLDLNDHQALAAAMNRIRELALAGSVQCHVHTVNAFQTLSLLQKYPAEQLEQGTRLPPAQLGALKAHYGLSEWTAVGGLYGSPAQVRAAKQALTRSLKGTGTLSFFDEKKVRQAKALADLWERSGGRGVTGFIAKTIKAAVTLKDFKLMALLPEMYGVLLGKPTWSVLKSAYFKSPLHPGAAELDPARDRCGLIWLAPAIPMTGEHAQRALAIAEPLFAKFDFNLSACLTMMNERTLFCLLGIFFQPEHEGERARAEQLYRALHAAFTADGYQQYRGGVSEWTASGASETTSAKLLRQLKRALDPSAVVAPGRYRI